MPLKLSSSYGKWAAARIICRYSLARLAERPPRPARRGGLPRGASGRFAVRFGSRACLAETRGREIFLPCRLRLLATGENNVSAVIEHLEGEARERLILWLRRRMQECDITMEALQHALEQDSEAMREAVRKIRYRDAWGNTWTGEGEQPEWLRRAVAAGQSVDHFLCARRDGHGQQCDETVTALKRPFIFLRL